MMGQHCISIFISASFIIVAREVQAGECILVIKSFYRNHFCSLLKASHEITSDLKKVEKYSSPMCPEGEEKLISYIQYHFHLMMESW